MREYILAIVLFGAFVSVYNNSLFQKKYELQDSDSLTLKEEERNRNDGLDSIVISDMSSKVDAMINFNFNSDEVNPNSYPLLNEYGETLSRDSSIAYIQVNGNTDNIGSEKFNHELSLRRAQAVVDYLVKNYNIQINRLHIKAYGKSNPIASNEKEEGRALNRRVEFVKKK